MQLGFVSAVFGDLSLEEVLAFAADAGFGCVELMCWPSGLAVQRHVGVTHVYVGDFNEDQAGRIQNLVKKHGVAISGLGYYPNPLDADPEVRRFVCDHLKKVIRAAKLLNVKVVNTFIGRDHTKSVEQNWPILQAVWPDIIREAETSDIVLGIENCPMLFNPNDWPGGRNLATSPALWKAIFEELRSPNLGLNFDPSHLVWQHIDYVRCVREFGPRIVHVHAKDTRIDADKLYEAGTLGLGWHTAKIPGLGDVKWGPLCAALTDVGYNGAVCIEVEDRAFEGSLANRQRALHQSKRFLEQFVE